MLALDAGAFELGALTLAPGPGCREPGPLLIPAAPALDGRMVGGRDPDPEPEPELAGGWMLKAGGGFAV